MKTITIEQVPAQKEAYIRHYLNGTTTPWDANHTQHVDWIRNMSDYDFMTGHNKSVRLESIRNQKAAENKAMVSAERKSTGISKKAYRAEYDRLNTLYKAGDYSVKAEMKRIQKFAF